jgi:hypothetical protein
MRRRRLDDRFSQVDRAAAPADPTTWQEPQPLDWNTVAPRSALPGPGRAAARESDRT